jgi:hypothetical protein
MAGAVVVSDSPMSETQLLRSGVLDGTAINFTDRYLFGQQWSFTVAVMWTKLNPWLNRRSLLMCRNVVVYVK